MAYTIEIHKPKRIIDDQLQDNNYFPEKLIFIKNNDGTWFFDTKAIKSNPHFDGEVFLSNIMTSAGLGKLDGPRFELNNFQMSSLVRYFRYLGFVTYSRDSDIEAYIQNFVAIHAPGIADDVRRMLPYINYNDLTTLAEELAKKQDKNN